MPRDLEVFKFLWKWKAASSQALAKKFFPECRPESAVRRLSMMRLAGYLESIHVERGREVWGLTKKSYARIRERLPTEVFSGHRPECPRHDFLTTAFHLGEWLTHQPENTDIFSERELRCIPDELWPEWIPQSTMHRPDGRLRIGESFIILIRILAIFVNLGKKAAANRPPAN